MTQPATRIASSLDGADRWPQWAVPQLLDAAQVAGEVAGLGPHHLLATELFHRWFTPLIDDGVVPLRSLAGVYRRAHAGSSTRIAVDGGFVVDRQDVVGRDGWWRTWSPAWLPTRGRSRAVRLLFSPRTDRLTEFVHAATDVLRGTDVGWLLACTTDVRRVRRASAAMLYLPTATDLPADLLSRVAPSLSAHTAPLCAQLAPGVAMACDPPNGMSFGEHRSHLLALALRSAAGRAAPLASVADVFAAHGIDPTHPYRST